MLQTPLGLGDVHLGLGYETLTVARNLASSGEFRDPYCIPTGPTAHVPPVYASVVALIYHGFGMDPILAALLLTALNACLLGAAAASLPLLSASVYGTRVPGILGAILLAASSRMVPQHDATLSALLLISTTLAIFKSTPWLAGVWTGVTLLANPVSLPALALVAARRSKRFAVIVAALALAICMPWMVRNWVVIGAPYFVRDNLGLELYVSNNDRAEPELVANLETSLKELHPTQSREEANLVAKHGEGAYNRLRLAGAMQWIGSHPGRFIELSIGRVLNYWFPSSRQGWQAHLYFLLTCLAIVGVWVGRTNPRVVTLGASALVYSLPFVVIQTDVRYSFPMLWVAATLAGYAVYELAARRVWPQLQHEPQSRQHMRREQMMARKKRM